jgi:site-specific recombinase XerD
MILLINNSTRSVFFKLVLSYCNDITISSLLKKQIHVTIIVSTAATRKANGSMEPASLESTNRLLKVVIALMLRPKDDKPMSLRQQIEVLYGLGIRPAEIAEILGRTATHVNKELSVSGIRKRKKEK